MPFGARSKTYNSRLAQELGAWAATQGMGEEFHLATFKAYFAEGLNLGDPAVLLDIAAGIGLPEKEAALILAERRFKEVVDRDWQESRFRGITAVPTFMMGNNKLIGAQEYQALEHLVTLCGAVRKSEAT